jgi:hypothetical protein
MGAAGRVRVVEAFSVETMVARTLDVYRTRVVQGPESGVHGPS